MHQLAILVGCMDLQQGLPLGGTKKKQLYWLATSDLIGVLEVVMVILIMYTVVYLCG